MGYKFNFLTGNFDLASIGGPGGSGKTSGPPSNDPSSLALDDAREITNTNLNSNGTGTQAGIAKICTFSWNYTDGALPAEGFELSVTDNNSRITNQYLSADSRSAFLTIGDTTSITAVIRAFRIDNDGIQFSNSDTLITSSSFVSAPIEVNHDLLAGFVSNEHIDHTSVSISAGAGLAGGGDISSNRSLAVDIPGQNAATVATDDLILIADVDDSNNLKKVTTGSVSALVLPDGDKGDITVSNSGATWTIDNSAVTEAKTNFITENTDGFEVTSGSTSPRTFGLNSGNVEIQGAGSATITFPNATSTLATLSLAETFQNKTFGSGTKIGIGSDGIGDLYYRNASGNLTRIPIGSSGQYLVVTGGLPAWDFASVPYRTIAFGSGGTSMTSTRWLGYEVGDTDIEHAKRIMPAGVVISMYCARENTTAEGKFNIYKNGSFVSGATASITAGNTTANVTGLSITFNGTTDFIAVQMQEVGSGPTSGAYQCLIYYVAANP